MLQSIQCQIRKCAECWSCIILKTSVRKKLLRRWITQFSMSIVSWIKVLRWYNFRRTRWFQPKYCGETQRRPVNRQQSSNINMMIERLKMNCCQCCQSIPYLLYTIYFLVATIATRRNRWIWKEGKSSNCKWTSGLFPIAPWETNWQHTSNKKIEQKGNGMWGFNVLRVMCNDWAFSKSGE
mgnify:CR=1 FL=1